jgi:hypothetical protein
MSRRLASGLLPLAALALLAPSALAQTPPLPSPAEAAPGQVIVVIPQGPPPGYLPDLPPAAPYPAPLYPAPPYAAPPYGAPGYAPYGVPQYVAPPPPEDAPRTSGVTAKLWAGPAFRRIFDVNIYAIDMGAGVGRQRGNSGFYGTISGLIGKTDHGLATYQIRPGFTWEGRLDRVHLGLGVDFSYIAVRRATTGSYMDAFGVGALALGTVDLVQGDGHALYLGAKMSAEVLTGQGNAPTPFMWGPSAMLGWRY